MHYLRQLLAAEMGSSVRRLSDARVRAMVAQRGLLPGMAAGIGAQGPGTQDAGGAKAAPPPPTPIIRAPSPDMEIKQQIKEAPWLRTDDRAREVIAKSSDAELSALDASTKALLASALSGGYLSDADDAALDKLFDNLSDADCHEIINSSSPDELRNLPTDNVADLSDGLASSTRSKTGRDWFATSNIDEHTCPTGHVINAPMATCPYCKKPMTATFPPATRQQLRDTSDSATKLYSTLEQEDFYTAADEKMSKKFHNAISNDPEIWNARNNWSKLSVSDRQAALQKVADHHSAAVGLPPSSVRFLDLGPGVGGGFSPDAGVIIGTTATNPDGTKMLFDDFDYTANSVAHENTHRYQHKLATDLRAGRLKPGDPGYDQARLYSNNQNLYIVGDPTDQKSIDTYKTQPMEAQAWKVGTETPGAFNPPEMEGGR